MNLPKLSLSHFSESPSQTDGSLVTAPSQLLELPERVIQFGTGAFLRGFADFFIDQANRNGRFNGRVVVVQSTNSTRSRPLIEQDGLYTVVVKGIEHRKEVNEPRVVSAFSRIISSIGQWEQVLDAARQPGIEFIISNTTEVGIRFNEHDKLRENAPDEFPAKLALMLHARFNAFNGDPEKGWTILPCELIKNNGDELKRCVIAYANLWELGENLINWIETANTFCNTLVDRIVPGTPASQEFEDVKQELGYSDDMLIEAEPYSLWAIQGDSALKEHLGLSEDNPSVVIDEDITSYRELKIGLLNGGHTLTVPIGFLLGLDTVLDNMRHPGLSTLIHRLLHEEIAPSLPVEPERAASFADSVMERWKNPNIEHLLLDITFQSTNKMRNRVLLSLYRYYEKFGQFPPLMAFGFACYLQFMHGVKVKDGTVFGERDGSLYKINDMEAEFFYKLWPQADLSSPRALRRFVRSVLSRDDLWGRKLNELNGWSTAVSNALFDILTTSPEQALEKVLGQENIVISDPPS
ncbi:MAG: tagaturonate reductase [Bacteroidota bacterium]